jgi:hypothetical protein
MRKYALLFLAFLLLTAGAAIPALAGNPWCDNTALITGGVVADNTLSTVVALPKNVSKIGIFVPTITSAAISLKVSPDGVTYDDLFCMPNGTNTILWSTAAGTGGLFVEVPCNMFLWKYVKVLSGAGQAANRYFDICGVEDPPVAIR